MLQSIPRLKNKKGIHWILVWKGVIFFDPKSKLRAKVHEQVLHFVSCNNEAPDDMEKWNSYQKRVRVTLFNSLKIPIGSVFNDNGISVPFEFRPTRKVLTFDLKDYCQDSNKLTYALPHDNDYVKIEFSNKLQFGSSFLISSEKEEKEGVKFRADYIIPLEVLLPKIMDAKVMENLQKRSFEEIFPLYHIGTDTNGERIGFLEYHSNNLRKRDIDQIVHLFFLKDNSGLSFLKHITNTLSTEKLNCSKSGKLSTPHHLKAPFLSEGHLKISIINHYDLNEVDPESNYPVVKKLVTKIGNIEYLNPNEIFNVIKFDTFNRHDKRKGPSKPNSDPKEYKKAIPNYSDDYKANYNPDESSWSGNSYDEDENESRDPFTTQFIVTSRKKINQKEQYVPSGTFKKDITGTAPDTVRSEDSKNQALTPKKSNPIEFLYSTVIELTIELLNETLNQSNGKVKNIQNSIDPKHEEIEPLNLFRISTDKGQFNYYVIQIIYNNRLFCFVDNKKGRMPFFEYTGNDINKTEGFKPFNDPNIENLLSFFVNLKNQWTKISSSPHLFTKHHFVYHKWFNHTPTTSGTESAVEVCEKTAESLKNRILKAIDYHE